MKVRALFFATYRDMVGTPAVELDLPNDATAADAIHALRGRGEPFDRLPATPAIAVNRRYASLDTPLEDAAELAFIPPVAGG